MSVWLVVPVKSLRDGKSRLSPALDSRQRSAFIEWLLARTLEQAAQFPGLERTLVVSACADTRARASACGAQALEEQAPGGLNNALRQAQGALAKLGATRMLMVSIDLPRVQPADLYRLAAASSDNIVALAPDRGRQGTNAMALHPAIAFDFSFGPHSFARHVDGVRRLDLQSAIVDCAGLAFDVDTPDQLAELRATEWHRPQLSSSIAAR